MAGMREKQGQRVFGLDIGTRSIVGTVGYINGNKFHVLAQRTREHETRSMLDGQIHDIAKVANTISLVKKQLEEDLDCRLTDVCIAAAGRVLRTVTINVEQTFESEREVTGEDIYALTTAGVEKAYEEFQKTNDTEIKFYCVGYTAMRYYMNGYQMGNLEGHKAKAIGTDLIATFLPDDVVDGLYKAVEQAGLSVANLTLEPIAAIQVAIPEKYRMLNMALVDVGAGTSDISITKEGTITAYGMIPMAGDSLTELVVQHCLVDFETAERIKRGAGVRKAVEYQDIMGLPQTITSKEVLDLLHDSVAEMTHKVAECIKALNGDKPVSAVFVVGGGGMVPGYTDELAKELGIAKERVAIRGQEVMQNIVFEVEDAQRDALMVTPIGICLSYYEQCNSFIFLEFNGQRVKLYDNGRLSVADAAMQVQFPNEDLFAKRGQALTFLVNGKSRMARGDQGEPAVIRLNGDPADMYTQVNSGDVIEVKPSTMGEPGKMELGKLPELSEQLHVYANGSRINLPKTAEVNGKRENEFYQIKEGDEIKIRNYYTVSEVAEFLDVPLGGYILVNDTPAKAGTKVYENFTVSWDMESAQMKDWEAKAAEYRAEDAESDLETAGYDADEDMDAVEAAEDEDEDTDAVEAAGDAAAVHKPAIDDSEQPDDAVRKIKEAAGKKSGPVREMQVIVNGMPVMLSGKAVYVFVDVFDFIDFNLQDSRGRSIVTLLNGQRAQYMQELKHGDVIDIHWDESGKKS